MKALSLRVQQLLRSLARGSALVIPMSIFLLVVLWNHVVITIPAGHAGVIWWRFLGGTDLASTASHSGTRLIFPWDKLYIYDMRLHEHATSYDVISKEGLHIKISVSFRWKANRENLGALHETIGPEYLERLLVPEIGSVISRKLSTYTAEEIFSTRRNHIQKTIYLALSENSPENGIGPRDNIPGPYEFISLFDVLLKEIVLPDRVRTAIEQKLEQAEVVQEFVFRVERERLESDRKAVEAEGIRRFQDIVSPVISDAYLRWRGIEATLKLAESNNSKVVIIGSGPGGLPIILNGLDGKSDTQQTAPAISSSGR